MSSKRFIGAALLSAALLAGLYYWAERQLLDGLDNVAIANSEKANEAVTTILATNLVGPFLAENGADTLAEPMSGETYEAFNKSIGDFLAGTYTRKVKLINAKGTIVYSSDASDLGEDYSSSDAVIRATRGTPTTELDFEETIMGLSGPDTEVWVMASYVPLYYDNGDLIGTAEIYSDYGSARAFLQQEINRARANLMVAFAAVAAMIIAGLWVVLRTGGPSET